MGKVKSGKKIYESLSKVVKGLSKSDAEKVLAKVDTPEKAVALTGDARAEYQNALDVIYGPKDTRMKDMGFGEQDWYHGTTVPIDKFQNDALGLSTNAQSAKKGFFFAQDPSTASDYAELAREKGVIREGDKVTTRSLSETAELHDEAYSKIRYLQMERDIASGNIQRQIERNNNTRQLIDSIKKRGDASEISERIPELEKKLESGQKFIEQEKLRSTSATNEIKAIDDKMGSVGQNVLPVKLRPGDGKVHVKDYKGQGYRDTTYADEMAKAQEKGASGVLFKNTYDPADPNNRVKQNIAAVFEPNQIRSKFAAFDPRFKDSPLLMAGAAGVAINMLPEESEASMGKGLKKGLEASKKTYESLSKILKKDLPQIDEVRAKQIAKAYDDMVHNPNDPEVAKAYDALINETEQQYIDLIKNKGLKVSPIKPDMENPYKTSQDLIKDVQENKHMWYFPTEQGFGSSGADVSNNPLLRATGQTIDGKPMPANDLFRIVHDYYGHTEPQFSFGPRGEEGAWREHTKMFSPEAQKALTTETRGQNSWVNYGPYGEANRANPAMTRYADQKTGLLPDWARDVSDPEGIPVVAYGKKGQLDATQFDEFANSPKALPGVEKYSTRIKGKIYDLSKDPLKILDQTKSPEEAKILAKEAGFDGISYFKDGQIKYETFQPVSMRPSYGVIGALGAGAALSSPSESEASMGKFNSLKKMWQVGDKTFPAANAAEALQVKRAMEAKGLVEPNRALVEADAPTPVANKPINNMARGVAPVGFSTSSEGMDVLKSGMDDLKEGFRMYRDNIVNPITNKLKKTLTPDINVGGQNFETSSAASDLAIDIAGDPLNAVGGGAGTALGALDVATSLGEEAPKRNYEGLKSLLRKK